MPNRSLFSIKKTRLKIKIEKRSRNKVEVRVFFERNKLREFKVELKNTFLPLIDTEDKGVEEMRGNI